MTRTGDQARAAAPVTPRDVVRLAFRRCRRGTLLTALMVSVHQVCEATTPVVVGLALDDAVAEGSVAGTWRWIALLAGVYVVLSLCGNGAGPVGMRAATRAQHDVRQAVVTRVLDPRGSAVERPTGEVLSVASSDAAEVGRGVDALAAGVSGLAALVVATVALLVTSVTLGLVALASVLVVVFVAPLLGRPLQRRSGAQQEAAARSAGVAVDMVEGLRVLGGLGAQRHAADRYRATSQVSRAARVRAGATEAVFEGVTTTIGGFLLVGVAAVGALLVLDGDLTPGQLVAGVGLAQFLVGPVSRISYAVAMAAGVRASARRVADLLATPYAVDDPGRDPGPAAAPPAGPGPTAPPTPTPTPTLARTLTLRGVRTTHLHGLDLEVGAGEVVGVVVDDMAQRADLLDLLARRRDPDAGTVAVGGLPVGALPLDVLHAHLVVAPHDSSLFTEPLADVVGEDGGAALAAARAEEVAHQLGGRGSLHHGRDLSGGQRQRLSLARALAADPPVLVLDDPTSALDTVTEAAVAQGLRDLRAGRRTTVLVTTSAGLLAATDRVLLVQDGRVLASGTHAGLGTDGRYAGLVLA